MPDIPGPSSSTEAARPALGFEAPQFHGRGVGVGTTHTTELLPLARITETFANLTNFVTIDGTPSVALGELSGNALVRHKMPLLSDSCKLSATVGTVSIGSARLAICGDVNLSTFYGLEVECLAGPLYKLHLISGPTQDRVLAGLFSQFFGFVRAILALLTILNPLLHRVLTRNLTVLTAGDEVSVWYDEPNATLRGYVNDVERLTLPVGRNQIPHGIGYRYHGIASGVSLPGILFTDYTAEDMGPSPSTVLDVAVATSGDVQWDATFGSTRSVAVALTAEALRGAEPSTSTAVTVDLVAVADVS